MIIDFSKYVNLWNQLTNVCWGIGGVFPRTHITAKNTVRAVEFAALQCHWTDWKWTYSYEIVENDSARWIMCSKVIFVKKLLFVIRCILFHEMLNSLLRTMTSHIFRKITVNFLLFFLLTLISHKHPRQYRILRYIQVIPARNIIEPLNVLKITHLFIDPSKRLLWIKIWGIRILLDLHMLLKYTDELVDVFKVKMQKVNLAWFLTDL